ncbi:MAG TPA: lipoprotein-releasing system ATP-binding protein LolD [Fibrobacteres bacterium]|jgi:lipoprotein-releasing system ATP-binding protein|nr:lipoprotein-releasing system ATP-binding protein LolD [Fibrobacterota bacterium]
MSDAILSLRKVAKAFEDTGSRIELFRNLDFDLMPGDFISIIGASGVGKSTLLHILGFLERPTEGDVLFRGEAVSGLSDARLSAIRNHEIGFVFQFHHLLPDLTVWENVLLPLRIGGNFRKQGRERARELLALVGLQDRLEHLPSQLSGGERQRAAVARALVNEPKVLLCDEPSGNLDARNSENLHQMLADLNRNLSIALLVVTHDLTLARSASRRLIMRDGALHSSEENAS